MPLSKIVAKSITDDTITTDQIADTSVHGRRNLIINGSFLLHNVAPQLYRAVHTTKYYSDRWELSLYNSGDTRLKSEQRSTAKHRMVIILAKLALTTADTQDAAIRCICNSISETQNILHLKYYEASQTS